MAMILCSAVIQHRGVPEHLAGNRRVIDGQASLGHHLFQIPVLLQIARGERRRHVVPAGSYAAMPKIVWMNWRYATGWPLAIKRI